jgi:hypothetical protein
LGNLEQEEVEVFSYFDTILVPVAVLLSLEWLSKVFFYWLWSHAVLFFRIGKSTNRSFC